MNSHTIAPLTLRAHPTNGPPPSCGLCSPSGPSSTSDAPRDGVLNAAAACGCSSVPVRKPPPISVPPQYLFCVGGWSVFVLILGDGAASWASAASAQRSCPPPSCTLTAAPLRPPAPPPPLPQQRPAHSMTGRYPPTREASQWQSSGADASPLDEKQRRRDQSAPPAAPPARHAFAIDGTRPRTSTRAASTNSQKSAPSGEP